MTLNIKQLSVGVLVLGFALTACNDDNEKSNSVSKKDAKSVITNFNTSTKSDLQNLANTEGLETIQQFFDLVSEDDPFGRIGTERKSVRKFFQEKGQSFRRVFLPTSANGRANAYEPFDFEGNKGVYEWNDAEGQFEKTAEATTIKIKFPAEGSEENNAELHLTAYADVEVYDEEYDEYTYEPTELKASLFVDNTKLAEIDLDLEYDDNGFPLSADISLMVTPYTATISFDESGSKSSTIGISLLHQTKTLLATSVTVTYEDATKSEESIKSITGFVQVNNLKLKGEVDVSAANKQNVDWNDIMKFALYNGDERLGTIVFVDENDAPVPYLKYGDGSKEKLETALQPVFDEIEALTESINVNG